MEVWAVKVGTIEAKKGEKALGFLKAVETHGRFDVHVPLHILGWFADIRGRADWLGLYWR
jgi:hypothetical protein